MVFLKKYACGSCDFSRCYDKMPDKKQLKTEGLILDHSFRRSKLSGWERHVNGNTRWLATLCSQEERWLLALSPLSPFLFSPGPSPWADAAPVQDGSSLPSCTFMEADTLEGGYH